MAQITVVGSLSCDLVMQVPRRPRKGETVIGTSFNTFVGGKGNNQALAAARAGGQAAIVGRVGDDHFAGMIESCLDTAGVDRTYLFRDPDVSTGIADILIDEEGDNSISIAPCANGRLSPEDVSRAGGLIRNSRIVLLQLEIPVKTVIAAARLAREGGATVVLNPAPAPPSGVLPGELLELVDIIVPNQTEAELLTGVSCGDLIGASDAARKLRALGPARVILTMGESGALVVDGRSVPAMTPAFAVEVVDTTAAGDAFCGALVTALSDGLSITEAVMWGCAAGALAATRLGAEPSLPFRPEIEKLVESRLSLQRQVGRQP